MLKKLFFLLVIFFIGINYSFAQSVENSSETLRDIKFKISTSDYYYKDTYKSDKGVIIKFYLRNIKDSVYLKNLDDFTWEISPMPKGAKFDKLDKEFTWKSSKVIVGDYEIKFKLSSPYYSDSTILTFSVEEEWDAYFIPGASYTNYMPQDVENYGMFQGFSLEYLLYSGIHRNDNRGPSHYKFYVKFDLMQSTKKEVTEAFIYCTGLNLSFERNPLRKYLVPFFGIEMGWLYQKKMKNTFFFAPVGGVWLYADQNIFVFLSGGYLYPSESIELYRGFRGGLGVNFSLW